MLTVTISIFLAAISIFFLWRKKLFSVFKKLGIPGPEPSLLFGNFYDLSTKSPLVCHEEWARKYGKVYGFYMGSRPVVVVSDLDLLKKIQISEFHSFINRPTLFVTGKPKPRKDDGFSYQLTNLRDKRWKEVRSILTPTFTTSKMRLMSPIINNAVDTLIENIESKVLKDEDFDIYELYKSFVMDVIGRTSFGIQTDCQRNPDDPFLQSTKVFFSGTISSWYMLLAFSFPDLARIWTFIRVMQLSVRNKGTNPIRKIIDTVGLILRDRRSDESKRRNDLLQLMIDAEMTDSEMTNITSEDLTAEDNNEINEKNNSTKVHGHSKSHSMTDCEILHNAVMFYLAGYETTSTALAFATHFLVHYPEVQEKIREEVNQLINKKEKLDYSSVQQLQYLDQVLKESLRMYPPAYMFVSRETGEDIQFGNLHLKKELSVTIPAYFIQRDKDNWINPDKFDPERFNPKNKEQYNPMAFQAFGAGPRNCIGMRFAMMTQKLTLANILRKYRLVKCDKTDKLDLELKSSSILINPKNGVYVRAIPL